MSRPWFSMYAADLLVDGKVALLSDAQFRMLVRCWCRACLDGGIPSDPDAFAKVMKCHGNKARKALDFLCDFFVKHPTKPGTLISLRMYEDEQKYNAIIERNRVNGQTGGRPRKPSGFVLGNPEITEPQPQPQPQKEEEQKPAPRKRATKAKESESLEDILGGGEGTPIWEAYWKLAALFGPSKNPAPKATAKLYAYAVVGFHPDHIHEKAEALIRVTSEPRYLPQLAKWLDGEGYRNPDPTPTTGAPNGTRPPSPHRFSGRDAALVAQVNGAHRDPVPPVLVPDEGGPNW